MYSINATFVTSWDVIIPRPSTQINAKRISTTRIYFAFLAVEMTDWMNLLCWYMFIINAMRSCSEHTTLNCVESYLYYIILVYKKNIFWGVKRGRKKNRQYTYTVENINLHILVWRVFLTCLAASGNELYIFPQYTYIVFIVVCQKPQNNCQIV